DVCSSDLGGVDGVTEPVFFVQSRDDCGDGRGHHEVRGSRCERRTKKARVTSSFFVRALHLEPPHFFRFVPLSAITFACRAFPSETLIGLLRSRKDRKST